MHKIHSLGKRYMEEAGFKVYTVPHIRFSKDAFSIADAIAIGATDTFLIQYSANQFHNIKKYQDFSRDHQGVFVILARWIDRKGFDFKIFKCGKEVNHEAL